MNENFEIPTPQLKQIISILSIHLESLKTENEKTETLSLLNFLTQIEFERNKPIIYDGVPLDPTINPIPNIFNL